MLELEREGFLSTAQDWGLIEAEWRYGLGADGLTTAERRRRVQAYAYSRTADGTEAFTALLSAMGCTGTVVLDGERWCVYLKPLALRASRSVAAAEAAGGRARKCPGRVVVRSAAWDVLDALEESWTTWGGKKGWTGMPLTAARACSPNRTEKRGVCFADKP